VAGSSDYPCGPFEPLAALSSCVERRALDGTVIGGSQRISVEQALRLYTTGAAHAGGEEHRKGTLGAGMLADFVELGRDPFDTPGDELADIEVRSTWVGARSVHQAA
jgi:predicted amidohydrolase YtcJ